MLIEFVVVSVVPATDPIILNGAAPRIDRVIVNCMSGSNGFAKLEFKCATEIALAVGDTFAVDLTEILYYE